MKKLIIIFTLLLLTGCQTSYKSVASGDTQQVDKITEILQNEGYNNIQRMGYDWFSCDKNDVFHDGFIADKNGRKIEGVVCSGWFNGYTIRFK